jgi:hypothetical protein
MINRSYILFLINFKKLIKYIKIYNLFIILVIFLIKISHISIAECAPMESQTITTFSMFGTEVLNNTSIPTTSSDRHNLNFILHENATTSISLNDATEEMLSQNINKETSFLNKPLKTFRFLDDFSTIDNASDVTLISIDELLSSTDNNLLNMESTLVILNKSQNCSIIFGCGPENSEVFYKHSFYFFKNFEGDFKIRLSPNIPTNVELSKASIIVEIANKFIKIINFMVSDLKMIRTNKSTSTFKLNLLETNILSGIETLKDILYIIDKKKVSKKGKKPTNEIELLLIQLESILISIQGIKKKYGSSFLDKNILLTQDFDILFKKINKFTLDHKKNMFFFIKYFFLKNI